jgi:uncharacterized membrane protein YcaP (DUF421 family)
MIRETISITLQQFIVAEFQVKLLAKHSGRILMDIWIDTGEVLLRSVVSVAFLFILAKFLGAKQISQMNFFDYIIGISIGSIAAAMTGDTEVPFHFPLVAMVAYAALAFLISVFTNKSLKMRRFLNGTPLILVEHGKIIRENFKKEKLDFAEFLRECRSQGYFNLSDIDYAIMETNLNFITIKIINYFIVIQIVEILLM